MLLIITVLGIILMFISALFPSVEIDGDSMYPTFENGEKVRSSRIIGSLKEGCVYVYVREDYGDYYYVIKRLTSIKKEGNRTLCYFEGDNADNSLDSRHYGWIDSKNIVAKVVERR